MTESHAIVQWRSASWAGWADVVQSSASARRRLDGVMCVVSWLGDEPATVAALRAEDAPVYTDLDALRAVLAGPDWSTPEPT